MTSGRPEDEVLTLAPEAPHAGLPPEVRTEVLIRLNQLHRMLAMFLNTVSGPLIRELTESPEAQVRVLDLVLLDVFLAHGAPFAQVLQQAMADIQAAGWDPDKLSAVIAARNNPLVGPDGRPVNTGGKLIIPT